MDSIIASKYLEDDGQTLEQRYPLSANSVQGIVNLELKNATEEQEHEGESQVKKSSCMDAYKPSSHPDITRFVNTGNIESNSNGFNSMFMKLRDSIVTKILDLRHFSSDILVIENFARTVEPGKSDYISDQYRQPAQWIVTSMVDTRGRRVVKHMVVFSEWEAGELYPTICNGQSITLHMYSPRPNLTFRSLENLTLYRTHSLPKD